HCVVGGKPDEVSRGQLVHPGRVEGDLGALRIENLEHLSLIGFRVLQHLLTGKGRPGGALARRVTDHPGEVTNQEDHLMAKLLELAEFVDQYRMTQVKIRSSRVEASLDAQRLTPSQLVYQLRLHQNLIRPA